MRYLLIFLLVGLFSCESNSTDEMKNFMVADPGHFHAGLVLKQNVDIGDEVFVYAPDGPELDDFMSRVQGYNSREVNPTNWNFSVYRGDDFFRKMLDDKPGDVLVLAGNNQKKTEYILDAVLAGVNIYSDKPMAINVGDYELLKQAFEEADKKGLLVYDIMTERFEITSMLQKALMHVPDIFGELLPGSIETPSVIKESVHHFFKYVSGKKLQRPPWFFDVEQEGEGIVDVTTHLVDLVQWACFPEMIIDSEKDLELLDANRWPTRMTADEFRNVTGLKVYPDFLKKDLDKQGDLLVYCNGQIIYKIKGVVAAVQVIWNYQAPEGGGDTHFSVIRGSLADLEIRQGAEQNYRPELYIIPVNPDELYSQRMTTLIAEMAQEYPGIELKEIEGRYQLLIPDELRIGHEAHFAQVTKKYLEYLEQGELPAWEVPNMLAKYYLTTRALELANNK